MTSDLAKYKSDFLNANYAYESAVQNGFEGTEAEWHEHVTTWTNDLTKWDGKEDTLDWTAKEDVDAMIDGTYGS